MSLKSDRLVARLCRLVSGALGLLLAATAVAAPPAWLLEDAQMPPLATRDKDSAKAEVLRDETIITVGPKGEWTETQRYAVRVCLPGGESEARMMVSYVEKSDKITAANAWLVTADKKRPRAYPRSEWVDLANMNQTTLYTDFRRLAHIRADARVGDVYGAEVVMRRAHNGGQQSLLWGGALPLRLGRMEMQLPPGWRPNFFWLKGDGPLPTVSADGRVWAWTVREVPAIRDEPWAPSPTAPYYLGVNLGLPDGVTGALVPRLETWGNYARWNETLMGPQCDTSAGLQQTVARVTAGLTDPWARLQALAQFAQKQTYIQQYYNSGVGFGYQPRRASEVLTSGYGDCKDKANLTKALLREAGYQAHIAVVSVGNGREVRPEWPGQ